MIDKTFWKQALAKAKAERAAVLEEQMRLTRELEETRQRQETLQAWYKENNEQIVQIDQTMTALEPLAHDIQDGIDPALASFVHELFANLDLDETSLANSCREVLKASDTFMTPVKIKAALIQGGYDEAKHTNLGASVHSVLKRLEQSGDVIRSTDSYQNAVYKWNTSPFKHSALKYIGQRNSEEVLAEAIRRRDVGEPLTPRMRRLLKKADEEGKPSPTLGRPTRIFKKD